MNWPRTTRDPLAGAWEEILALVQAHPEWNSTQILQELRRRDPEREFSVCPGTMIQGVARIRQQIRACWEESWPTEMILAASCARPDVPPQRGSDTIPPVDEPPALPAPLAALMSTLDQDAATLHPSSSDREEKTTVDQAASFSSNTRQQTRPFVVMTIERAITTYLGEVYECGRTVKTVEWHQLSLTALQQYLWDQFRLTEVHQLSRIILQRWLADLRTTPSVWTGEKLSINTMAAYARSARAFCNWLVQQEYLSETPFPKDSMPKAQRCLPQPIDQETFARLLQACQLPDGHAGQDHRVTARNQAILWLLLDTGLSASQVCGLRLGDVDCIRGAVTVREKGGGTRTLLLSEQGQRAIRTYLDHARLTPAWQPVLSEVQDILFLTEVRQPLTKNSLILLFGRLNQRAGFTTTPICASMLRDTYTIRFLQDGGDLSALQEQLGLAAPISVKRYQRFCDEQRRAEAGDQADSDGQAKPPQPVGRSKSKRRKARGQRGVGVVSP